MASIRAAAFDTRDSFFVRDDAAAIIKEHVETAIDIFYVDPPDLWKTTFCDRDAFEAHLKRNARFDRLNFLDDQARNASLMI